MIVYIALCDKNGIVARVIRNVPAGLLNEGQDIRCIFENEEQVDSLFALKPDVGVSSRLHLKASGMPPVCLTVMPLDGQMLVLIYDIDDPSQLSQLTEMVLSLLHTPGLAGQEPYGHGYYEIQKLNSRLINYQRTLAKSNARLQGLLDEAHTARCTIEELERDTLTGLYREKIFYSKASDILEKNSGTPFDIIAVDIEQFKIVNDTFGSAAGDRLLMDLAVCLLSIQSDQKTLITRARADTFFALLPRRDDIYETLEKNIGIFKEEYPLPMRLQIKTGVFEITDHSLSVARMCDRALMAANSIKGNFSQNQASYDSSMHEKLMQEQKIINTMVESLSREEFLIYLQPKVEVETGRFIGAEALVRWNHPEYGLISPEDFIPVFERNSFIYTLDIYVWEKVCGMLQSWKRKGISGIPVSVNVSRTDLYHENLAETLDALIRKYGLRPEELHLEITESAYVNDSTQLLTVVHRLKEKGFIIEMDDFGSGYSSLNTLCELPVDVMKLDQKFIRQSEDEPRRQEVMQVVIQLARKLHLQVIAEGVETEAQARLLKNMGCRYAQGYLYGRPMPEDEFLSADLTHVPLAIQDIPPELHIGCGKIDQIHQSE